ncbi:hypothetical protein [Nocardia sp. NPDC050710]|uniref:hypothetical protein n=1 Tax=Nocardia sp. NPDC050710 TaxID=3157220 RepID=UPI0033FF96C1
MIVFDSGALIGLQKNQGRMLLIMNEIMRNDWPVIIPATVYAQVWSGDPRQHRLGSVLKWADIADLDLIAARAVGRLLGETGTRDVVDAHVVVVARGVHAAKVITSDPGDLLKLDPDLPITVV